MDAAHHTWRLIESGYLSGAENMAVDEALLEAVADGHSLPILRIYRWRPATVTLGYGQRGSRVVNLDACRRLGYDVVRRCTGGRAVLHDREVTYAVIAPAGQGCFPPAVLESYRVIAEVLRDVYRSFGVDAQLSPRRVAGSGTSAAEQSACFTAPGQYELLYRGCKLAGCAQKRLRGAFLQHGSLPVDLDLEKLYMALDTERRLTPVAGARLLRGHVGWLNRWSAESISVEAVEERLPALFAEKLCLTWDRTGLTADERGRAVQLQNERYAVDAWNLQGLC